MLVSHNHKFFTIDIPKTGTRTFRACLATKAQHKDGLRECEELSFAGKYNSCKYKQHSNLTAAIYDLKIDGYDPDTYFSFSFVRNPWARLVSLMLYHNRHFKKNQSLEFYIDDQPPQFDWLYSKDYKKTVDYIAKFENYKEELLKFFDRFNINLDSNKIPHLNENKKYDYKDYYTKELIDKVYEKDYKAIELMGYTYDG